MAEKEHRLSIRVPEQLKIALDRVERTTRISQADLVRACIEALIEYVDNTGEITCPLIIKPKSSEKAYRPEEISRFEERPHKKKPAA